MITGGSPVIYDKSKKSRFGILAKNARDASDVIWVESLETFCFHLWNAWEEPESDEKTGKSELQIVNAMNLQLEASVKLPSRVPYGFHGTFIDSKDLGSQA
ncbi:hypothetical protein SLA2020_474670 [Shorea laevis]